MIHVSGSRRVFSFAIVLLSLFLGWMAVPASAEFPTDPAGTCPLQAGEAAPDAELHDSQGTPTTLYEAMGDGPAVVVFYRGGW